MGEVKLLSEEEKARLKELAEAATPGPWVADERTPPGRDDEWAMVRQDYGIHGHIAYETGFHSDEQARSDFAFIAAAHPQAVLALLTELEVTERHRHQSHESIQRALLQIEHLEAANASLRRDLAAARDETQALAQTIQRDEDTTGQA